MSTFNAEKGRAAHSAHSRNGLDSDECRFFREGRSPSPFGRGLPDGELLHRPPSRHSLGSRAAVQVRATNARPDLSNNRFGSLCSLSMVETKEASSELTPYLVFPKNASISSATFVGRVMVGTCPAPSMMTNLLSGIFADRFFATSTGVMTSRLP